MLNLSFAQSSLFNFLKLFLFVILVFFASVTNSASTINIKLIKGLQDYYYFSKDLSIVVLLLNNNQLLPSRFGKPVIIDPNQINFEFNELIIKNNPNENTKNHYEISFSYLLGLKKLDFILPFQIEMNDQTNSINLSFFQFKDYPHFLELKILNLINEYATNDKNQLRLLDYLNQMCQSNIDCYDTIAVKNYLLSDYFNNHSSTIKYSNREIGDIESFSDILFFISGLFLWGFFALIILFFFLRKRFYVYKKNKN